MDRRQLFQRAASLAVVLGAGLAALPLDDASAQRRPPAGRWELLGSQSVGFGIDRDVIRVGRTEGRFRAIRLRVRDNDIEVLSMKVVYGNGAVDDIAVRQSIRRGGETRAIDLKGEARFIREVQLVYRSRPNFRGRARVDLYGLNA